MKKLGLMALSLAVVVLGFWAGLMLFFPGEVASELVENRLNRFGPIQARLTPARMGLTSLYVEKLEVVRIGGAKRQVLFTLHDVRVPYGISLFQGLPLKADLGENGEVSVFFPWGAQGEASVNGEVVLEEIPVPDMLKPLVAKGRLELEGALMMDGMDKLRQSLPTGFFRLRGENLEVRGAQVSGLALPLTTLQKLDADIESKGNISIKRFDFSGDLQGQVTGDIAPNMASANHSRLNLRMELSPRKSWIDKLGGLKPIVEAYLSQGKMAVRLGGTLANPQPNMERK